MSNQNVNQYRLFCDTESAYVYTWQQSTPVCCPNNNTHLIDTNSISVINSVNTNSVNVIQSSSEIPGNYRVENISLSIPPNTTITKDISWPYPIGVLTVNWDSYDIHTGDIINSYVAPNTTIGGVTQPINSGDNQIHVSSTVFEYINLGYLVSINSGSQTINMGECCGIDIANGTILCTQAASQPMAPGTYVQMTIWNIRNIYLPGTQSIRLANKHLNSSFLPTNIKVRCVYQNNSDVAKLFTIFYELLY